MIEVRGPNGVVVQFPDGTPSEQIDSAMRQATGAGSAPAPPPAAPPRTMAPAPYFRPQPTPQAPPAVAQAQPGITPGAFGNPYFSQTTTARNPGLGSALELGADLVRMGQPGGGAVYPGPGPTPPGGAPVHVAQAPPKPAPNLSNSAVFAAQGQTDRGWAGPLEEAMQNAAGRQNMGQIVQGNTPPPGENVPPFGQWVLDNPGSAAMIPLAGTPVGAWRLGAGLLANLFRTGTVGAGLNTAAQLLNGERDPAELGKAAGWGAAAGAGIPAAVAGAGRLVGAGVNAVASHFRAPAPTADALRTGAQAAYAAANNSGIAIRGNVFGNAVQDIEQQARLAGLDPTLHPRATAVLGRLTQAGNTGAVGIQELETLRRVVRGAASSFEPDERRIANILVNGIDDLMARLTPADVLGGANPQVAIDSLREARDMWTRLRKSETIEDLTERARNAVGANYTQAGMLTALRQQFRALANGPQFRTFTPDEQIAILHIVRGGSVENMLRWIGKFSLRNPLMMALSGGTAVAGQLAPAAIGVAAEGARRGAAAIGTRNVEDLNELVRRGGAQPNVGIPARVQELFNQAATAGGRVTAVDADEKLPGLLPGSLAPFRLEDLQRSVRTVPVAP